MKTYALLLLSLFTSSSAFAAESLQTCRDGSAIRLSFDCSNGCSIRYYPRAADQSTYSSGSLGALANSQTAVLIDEEGTEAGSARAIGSSLILTINGKQTVCKKAGSIFE